MQEKTNPGEKPSVDSNSESGKSSTRTLSRRSFFGVTATAATAGLLLEPLSGLSKAEAAEVGPLIGDDRLSTAFNLRLKSADRMLSQGIPVQTCNGDEDLYPNYIGNYSKGLPHNTIGHVVPSAYAAMLKALSSGDPADFELIPLGGSRKLTNPQAGLAFDTHGNDPHQFALPPAPAFSSDEEAAEMVELYWMALLRDSRFEAPKPLAAIAAAELSSLPAFKGPRIGGQVTLQTLFRDDLPGCLAGPYISQFLLRGTPFGAEYVVRKLRTTVAGNDHGKTFADWLAIQNGNVPGSATYDNTRRYVRNGRDLAEWVHMDVLFQAYFNACLILGTPPDPSNTPTGGGIGCPLNPGNPYNAYTKQDPFGVWGGPFFKTLVAEVAHSLRAVWFQKWFVHRRLRPEAFGGRVHVHKSGLATYPIHSSVLNSNVVSRVHSANGTYLLPLAFPEGSPTHPAYGAGHATVAGACVTLLKAVFDETFVLPEVLVPTANGANLEPYVVDIALTVGGELNKLASNIATGRNHAGVHWRTDAIESLKLGEAVAIAVLQDHLLTFNEGGSFQFTKFDGTPVVIS